MLFSVDNSCKGWMSMVTLPSVFVVIILLTILSVAYAIYTKRKMQTILGSLVADILIVSTLVSIGVTAWIILGDKAFDCKESFTDFIVHVNNGVYFSCLFCFVIPSALTMRSRLFKFVIKWLLLAAVVAVQVALAVVAHFRMDRNMEEETFVTFCYRVRRQVTYMTSFCFGLAVLIFSDLMLLKKLYVSQITNTMQQNRLNACLAVLCQVIPCAYALALSFVFFPSKEKLCQQHAGFLIVLALFPAVLSIIFVVVAIVNAKVRKRRKYHRDVAAVGEFKVFCFLIVDMTTICNVYFRSSGKYFALCSTEFLPAF